MVGQAREQELTPLLRSSCVLGLSRMWYDIGALVHHVVHVRPRESAAGFYGLARLTKWARSGPEVGPHWHTSAHLWAHSVSVHLRYTSTHFGDIPRGRQMQVAGEVVEGKESVVHVPGETAYSPA